MATLLIVYHSRTGGARQMAQAAFQAAQSETDTVLLTADKAMPDHVLDCDG